MTYYYDDASIAAYMAMNFGIKFSRPDCGAYLYFDEKSRDWMTNWCIDSPQKYTGNFYLVRQVSEGEFKSRWTKKVLLIDGKVFFRPKCKTQSEDF